MSVVAQSPFTAGTKRLFDDENDAPRGGSDDAAAAAGAAGAGAAGAGAADSPLDGRCKRVRFAASSSPQRGGQAAGTTNTTTTTTGVHPATFAALCALFPGMDDRVVSGVLAECGSDVDAAIRRLTQLRLGAGGAGGGGGGDGGSSGGGGAGGSDAGGSAGAAAPLSVPASEAGEAAAGAGGAAEAAAAAAKPPVNDNSSRQPQTADQWTEALVTEMSAARDLPDARGRASKLLAAFEAFVSARRQQQQQQNGVASTAPSTPTGSGARANGGAPLLLQTPGGTARSADDLVRENAILKRAVQVQHARLQQVEAHQQQREQQREQQQAGEAEALRRALGECQQRVRALESTNYALALHLQRASFGDAGNGGGGGGGGGGGPGDGGGDGGGGGGGYYSHPFQPPPPPDVY